MTRRNTAAKTAVLSLLGSSPTAMSQNDMVRELEGSIDGVTIYRVLNTFVEDGLVHKILSDDGRWYFALCRNCTEKRHADNHFHFRCINCNRIECLKEEVRVGIPMGYRAVSLNCLVTGYCGDCS